MKPRPDTPSSPKLSTKDLTPHLNELSYELQHPNLFEELDGIERKREGTIET